MLGRWQRRGGRPVDPQIDAALVQRRHLVGRHEALSVLAIQHDPVEDVLRRRGDHVRDRANLLPVGRKHRHARLQHLVGDRQPFIHDCGH